LDDDSGAAFKSYPGHNPSSFRTGGPSFAYESTTAGRRSVTDQYARLSRKHSRKSTAKKSPPNVTDSYFAASESEMEGEDEGEESEAGRASKANLAKPSVVRLEVPEGEEGEEGGEEYHKKYRATSFKVERAEDIFDESSHHKPIRQKSRTFSDSSAVLPKHLSDESFPEISEMLEEYGLPPDTYLDDGEPWRSYLVDALYKDDGQEEIMNKMYNMAEAVLGVYEREVMVGDDFTSELNKIMRGEAPH